MTNLRRHLFVRHDVLEAAYDSQIAQINKRIDSKKDSQQVLSKERKKQLDEALLNAIINDGLPFTTFSKAGILNLIHTLDSRYQPPSRTTIASRIANAYYEYIDQVKVSNNHRFILEYRTLCEYSFDYNLKLKENIV